MQITKTDYLDYTFCRKNLWLKKHKPELFANIELSDFEKKIIDEGNLADEEARSLFPGGVLVGSEGGQAILDTRSLLTKKEKIIFQATFSQDTFFIRSDVLVYDETQDGYELYEVKAANNIKRKEPNNYINDLAFQKIVIEKAGVKIVKTGVIHLNSKYKRFGKINYHDLFVIVDVSDEVDNSEEVVEAQMGDMKKYLSMPEERGCACLFRGRNAHCTTFAYSNPNIPEYSVHDINRIGASARLLQDWIDTGVYKIEDIPKPELLKGIKKLQYDSYMTGKALINKNEVKRMLGDLIFPLYFFDYEGFISAIPAFDGFAPYEQVPFQYSLHIMEESGAIEHREFLITDPEGDITFPLIESMTKHIDRPGTVIAWYSSYEKQRNIKLAELHPNYKDFLEEINEKMFDLMTIFSSGNYVDPAFKGSFSIKKVLPVIVPELTYKNLHISKGDQASERWERMISPDTPLTEKKQIKKDLLEYCKMDTFAMVRIYQVLKSIL